MAITAYVLITLKKGKENNVAKMLEQLDGVLNTTELYGVYDIITKVKKESMLDLQKFLTEDIRVIDGIEQTSTMIAIK